MIIFSAKKKQQKTNKQTKQTVLATSDGEPCMVVLTNGFLQISVNEAEYPVIQVYYIIHQKAQRTRKAVRK